MSLTILVPQNWGITDILKSMLIKGRPVGQVKSSYIEDLASLRKAVVLCGECQGTNWFDWKKKGYYSVWQYEQTPVDGPCDACKQDGSNRRLFLHESTAHQAWLMKDRRGRHYE